MRKRAKGMAMARCKRRRRRRRRRRMGSRKTHAAQGVVGSGVLIAERRAAVVGRHNHAVRKIRFRQTVRHGAKKRANGRVASDSVFSHMDLIFKALVTLEMPSSITLENAYSTWFGTTSGS